MSTTKTGKSELLKALCLNYVQQADYASVLVLDPGGDMSRQIAQWPELIPQGRLLYLDPALSDTHVPVIFMGPGVKPGKVHREVQPADVAPTLAAALGMTAPASAQGEVLAEVVDRP